MTHNTNPRKDGVMTGSLESEYQTIPAVWLIFVKFDSIHPDGIFGEAFLFRVSPSTPTNP